MPIGAFGDAGRQVFALLHRLRQWSSRSTSTCAWGGVPNFHPGLPHVMASRRFSFPDGHWRRHDLGDMNPCRPQENGIFGFALPMCSTANRPELHQLDQDLQDYQPHWRFAPAPQAPLQPNGGRAVCGRPPPLRRRRLILHDTNAPAPFPVWEGGGEQSTGCTTTVRTRLPPRNTASLHSLSTSLQKLR